jgi:hypothetical protein
MAKEYIVSVEVHKQSPFHDITFDKVIRTK